jgi:Domain of unknown function (DUF4919)
MDLPMRSLLLAMALSLAAMTTRAAAPAAPDDTEAHYQALLATAKATAPRADWGGLRLAYSRRAAFRAFAQSAAKRQMFEAAQNGDCATALPAARAALEAAYVDIDAHMVAAFCEDAAGDKTAAQLDRDVGAGLVASIETGDGLSTGSAFTPIDVDEEYAVMRALGAHVTDQALVQSDGHSYDALTAVDQAGHKATYYFLIDRVLAAEAAALKPGSVSEGGPPGRSP